MPAAMAGVEKARKPTKNAQRRQKKKLQKQEVRPATVTVNHVDEVDDSGYLSGELDVDAMQVSTNENNDTLPPTVDPKEASNNRPLQPVEPPANDPIQDVPATLEDYDLANPALESDLPVEDPLFQQYASVFEKFGTAEDGNGNNEDGAVFYDDDDMIQGEDEEEETQKKLNKKQKKQRNKLTVAQLKAIVDKPDRVDWTDVSAPDPKLLIGIKSMKNVVPVPQHWSLKREYLSSKRGVEKAPFKLPQFIADTGVSAARDAVLEKQANSTLKQRQRERVQGKTGKVDLNFQKLYDAFFRLQTKPQFSTFGEVYFEGKENEKNFDHVKPGQLSEELQASLNMPPGAPPPWLVTMQKVGPPPSYPALRIPGLNAPIPPGASWGFNPGGYGKPPLDEKGVPLYGGDVLGVNQYGGGQAQQAREQVDKSLWGQLMAHQEEEEEEEEEDSDEDSDEDEEEEEEESRPERSYAGNATVSGINTYGGTQTGVGKVRPGNETEVEEYSGPPRAAGQVLEQQNIRSKGFFGGDHAYKLPTKANPNLPTLGAQDNSRKRKVGDLDVSMDMDALERDGKMSKEELQKRYEAENAKSGGVVPGSQDWNQEDLSQMIAEESSKRQKRDEKVQKDKKRR
ncbi:hypothetical protein MBLNU230_g5806t1 [Neophaeotheca triangularis]